MAIVPVGQWSDGRKPPRNFTTYAYGHPNLDSLLALAAGMTRERGEPLEVMAGQSAKKFKKNDSIEGDFRDGLGWNH